MTVRSLLGGFLLAAAAHAQDPVVVPPVPVKVFAPAAVAPAAPGVVAPTVVASTQFPPEGPRMWANVEWLSWRFKDGPAPALVTTGPLADPVTGALGQPGTRVLFGGDDAVDYGTQAGFRLAVGGWLGADRALGWEVGGFLFREDNGTAFAAQGGNLFAPYTDTAFGPSAAVFSLPVIGLTGRVTVADETQFWGVEGNGLLNLSPGDDGAVSAVVGVRSMNLYERLTFDARGENPRFNATYAATDRFRTRNEFYGAQVGAQAAVAAGRFFASVRGTVALGGTRQSYDVAGRTTFNLIPPGAFPGGVFAQPTNIGHARATDFSVVPQVGLKAGVDVFPFLRLFAGYDFLYWTNVARPGDQIDTTLNTSQVYNGALAGPARPALQMRSSDFYAHGLSIGLQLRY